MSEGMHDERHEEVASFLLGALDPAETAELERHLAGCEDCRAELERLRPVVWALPESVERIEPPALLRKKIMGEVRADASAGSLAEETVGEPAATGRRWLGLPRLSPRLAAGLVAIALVLVGVAAFALQGGGSDPDTTTVFGGEAPGVTAKVVSEGDVGTLHLANLRALPPDEALQAWVQRGERVEAAGSSFDPGPDGTATASIADMRGVEAVMVTAEPRAGSARPTSTPLVSVEMPQ